MSTYLITGATGGLGSSAIKHLSKRVDPSEIAVLVRDAESEKAKSYKKKGYDLRVADYDNKETLVAAFKNIDALYFVSGSDIPSREPQHKNVVEAAKEAAVKHVVYTSAGRKDASQNSPVAAVMDAHIKTENWLKRSGLNYTILRHNLYAEVVPMFLGKKEALLGSKTLFLPTEEGKTGFALREDLAEAGMLVLKNYKNHTNTVYTLDGPKAIDFKEIALILSKITNEKIAFVSPDSETFKSTMASYGVPEEAIGIMLVFSLGIAAGEFNSESNDLEVLLGRKPKPVSDLLEQVYG
ncbi:NAD(P)H dehydrogenase (quinone) [Leeuwenhoekiella aestuarii]|uniref:NAD(P)H dehydrogenase (Quinone) n=1 Tax=Leeuwenhoekiella aestuarii TaxID=2249426 RepID=A0A4Q0NXS4_9FLAO|nr:SDR family oxidoreductase [Leeuwenhoekiella aestuarii]RXG15620.1 NAD(P)H dehydrogenase (quinone) [Leeuwenhoekiella aestuarii]RXG17271.1 NAD(P)H dehydrogenase (quinone) [Leeuwenhoekiella aestuarii]